VNAPETLVRSYARWRASPLAEIVDRVEMAVVFDLAGRLEGRRVHEVGTGDGTYAIEAARRGAVVTALDPNPKMLSAARARATSSGIRVAFREGRVEQLPFEDGAFQLVLAVTALCFVARPDAALREMARVLTPGGRLVLGELGRFSTWAAGRRVRGCLGSSLWRLARFWSRRELAALAARAGLRVLDVRGTVFFPPSGLAARLAAPLEPTLTRLHAPGGALLVLAADRPGSTT
jgi:SAM-dependent methyltransferase